MQINETLLQTEPRKRNIEEEASWRISRIPCVFEIQPRNSNLSKNNCSNSVFVFYDARKFCFYRGVARVIFYQVSVFSLATSANSVFIGFLSTSRGQAPWINSCIIISGKRLIWGFGIYRLRKFLIGAYFSVTAGEYRKHGILYV